MGKNREITYYTLSLQQAHIEEMADSMDTEGFILLGFEDKWFEHLWIKPNNEAFLSRLLSIQDIDILNPFLSEQLKLYVRKNGDGFEKDESDFYKTYKARARWLKHTKFICKTEYTKSGNEVFNEAVQWCIEDEVEWLETFNPYSPAKEKQLLKKIKEPLYKELNRQKLQSKKIESFFTENQLRKLYIELTATLGRFEKPIFLSNNSEDVFLSIFNSNKILDTPFQWNYDTKLLVHLLKEICSSSFYQTQIERRKVFTTMNGNPLSARNIASTKNKILTEGSHLEHKEIERILSSIKNSDSF